MITQGICNYQVVGTPPETTQIWMRNVSWHFYDAIPVKGHLYTPDDNQEPMYWMKVFKKGCVHFWVVCYELDETGRRDMVEEPETLPALPEKVAVFS
jgi:hypothetical protein